MQEFTRLCTHQWVNKLKGGSWLSTPSLKTPTYESSHGRHIHKSGHPSLFCILFVGQKKECVGHSFADVDHLLSIFARCLDSNPESFRSRRATNHPPHSCPLKKYY